jgi:hypothetical protein
MAIIMKIVVAMLFLQTRKVDCKLEKLTVNLLHKTVYKQNSSEVSFTKAFKIAMLSSFLK